MEGDQLNYVVVAGQALNHNGSSIFGQDWWLDAVAPNQWKNLLEEEGHYFPIVCVKRWGQKAVTMPSLTPVLGPSFPPELPKASHHLRKVLALAAERLKGFSICTYSFSPAVTDMLPFIWNGFEIKVQYTQQLSLQDPQLLWEGFESETRNLIRKGEKSFQVVRSQDWALTHQLATCTLHSKKKNLSVSLETFERLAKACIERNCGFVFSAMDQTQKPVASIFIVTFKGTAYYLLGGIDRERPHQGAMNLLIWEALKYLEASTETKVFDFEGSMIPSIDRFFRSFGTTQIPYFVCTRATGWLKGALRIRNLFRRL